MSRIRELVALAARPLCIFATIAGCVFGFSQTVSAAMSQNLLYQAHLSTLSGAAVPDGGYTAKFSLYDSSIGGTRVWTAAGTVGTPTTVSITVSNGAFSVKLGDVTLGQNDLGSIDWSQPLYLGITIGSDAEMTPRRELTSVPSAFMAGDSSKLQGMSPNGAVFGGQTLFTINMSSATAATSSRSAFDVSSAGTSDVNDYLFRGINNLGQTVFSLNRQGNVSTTNIQVADTVTTTNLNATGVITANSGAFNHVNIGTDNPSYALSVVGEVYSKDSGYGYYTNTDAAGLWSNIPSIRATGVYFSDAGSDIVFRANNREDAMYIDGATGNVGIGGVGETHPATALEVLGTASSTNVNVSDTVSSTNAYVSDSLTVDGEADVQGLIAGMVNARFSNIRRMGYQGDFSITMSGIKGSQLVGKYYYALNATGIHVFDMTDPLFEKNIGTISVMGGTIHSFYVQGNYVYATYDDGGAYMHLGIYNTTEADFTRVGDVIISTAINNGYQIRASGQVAYITSESDSGIIAVDIRNPMQPYVKHAIITTDAPVEIQINERNAYVITNGGGGGTLLVYDLTDPLFPVLKGSLSIGSGAPWHLQVNKTTLYITDDVHQMLHAVDVSDPGSPTAGRDITLGAYHVAALNLMGDRLLLGTSGGDLVSMDTRTARIPAITGTLSMGSSVLGIATNGLNVLIATGGGHVQKYTIGGVRADALDVGTGAFYRLNVAGDVEVVNELSAGSVAVGNGGIHASGGIAAAINSATSTAGYFVNNATGTNSGWGVYTNRLLVGDDDALDPYSVIRTATGTVPYSALFAYDSSKSQFGVCIDDTHTASTCLNFADTSTAYSLMADDAIGANAFDLAERYEISGGASLGDVLVIDKDSPMHMKKSTGIPYDPNLSGVVSTRPGFVLGSGGGASVALVGRVPVTVTVSNGAIQVGDPITSSNIAGVAMKATQAGRILGHALQATTVDGQIEVFLQPGFDASGLLQADGSMTVIAQNTGLQAQAVATASVPAQSSRSLSFEGSVWDVDHPVVSEFRLFNRVQSLTDTSLAVSYGASSSSIFAISQDGSLSLAGDLALAGKLYPSARGHVQSSSYIFVDDSQPDQNYISTNADGWQSQDSYDYAERYQSPDKLTPGDLVTVHRSDRLYVQRSLSDQDMLVGIVSTKPGFIAGRPQKDAYPIALAGHVPAHVSTINGAINPGDPLAPSTIPGVAVKAIQPGPIVGLALDSYAGSDVGTIEVFVNPTWWGGATDGGAVSAAKDNSSQGFAEIVSGKTKAHVALTGFVRYPLLQVTPYAQMEGGWWIDHVTTQGFDIVLGSVIGHNARFSWQAQETADGTKVALSSGQIFDIDPISGQIQFPPGTSDQDAPAPEAPAPDPTPTSTQNVAPETTTTQDVVTTTGSNADPVPSAPISTDSVPVVPDSAQGSNTSTTPS